jgi:hypothetical protein
MGQCLGLQRLGVEVPKGHRGCRAFNAGGHEGGGTKGKDIGAWRSARGLAHCLEGATPQSSMSLWRALTVSPL